MYNKINIYTNTSTAKFEAVVLNSVTNVQFTRAYVFMYIVYVLYLCTYLGVWMRRWDWIGNSPFNAAEPNNYSLG